ISLFCGLIFFAFVFSAGMSAGWLLKIGSLAFLIVATGGLTVVFRPKRIWLFPLEIVLPIFLVGVLVVFSGDQPTAVVSTWVAIGIGSGAVALATAYATHFAVRGTSEKQ